VRPDNRTSNLSRLEDKLDPWPGFHNN